MMRKLIFGLAAVLVILGLGLTPGVDAAERKDVLVIGMATSDLISLDPAKAFEFSGVGIDVQRRCKVEIDAQGRKLQALGLRHALRQRGRSPRLQRIAGRDQPPHPVQSKALQRSLCDMHMPRVRRIKGPAQQTDHLTALCNRPRSHRAGPIGCISAAANCVSIGFSRIISIFAVVAIS